MGVSYRACVVQLRQTDKISRSRAQEFLSWQPKALKRLVGDGVGPLDPWADVWPLDESDSGRSLPLRVNDEIRIMLPETPSTGYRWYDVGGPEDYKGFLEKVGDE